MSIQITCLLLYALLCYVQAQDGVGAAMGLGASGMVKASKSNMATFIEKLLEQPNSRKALLFLYQYRRAVYFSTVSFIIGTTLLIIILLMFNPLFVIPNKCKSKVHSAGEVAEKIVERKKKPAKVSSGQRLECGDSVMSDKRTMSAGRDTWGTTLSEIAVDPNTVTVQPKKNKDLVYQQIMELSRQKKPLLFKDLLELKSGVESYTFVAQGSRSQVYQFQNETQRIIFKIYPVFGERLSETETTLRNGLHLNRLHSAQTKYVCRNFVRLGGVALVQDEYPKILRRLSDRHKKEIQRPNYKRLAASSLPQESVYICRNYLVLSMEFAGTTLSKFRIRNGAQAKSILQQLCFTIATGEKFAGYMINNTDVDKVLVEASENQKLDFRIDGISVAVKLVDGVMAKICGSSTFSLSFCNLNENQLMELAEGRIHSMPSFRKNIGWLSKVVSVLLEKIPRDVPSDEVKKEQKFIFELMDILNHLNNFDSVYRFTMHQFIQPRQSLAAVDVSAGTPGAICTPVK